MIIHPIYDIYKTYSKNYKDGPSYTFKIPKKIELKPIKLWDFTINSQIGVASGPLLNSQYVELYGKLGFDITVYKTVRTIEYKSHKFPNCIFLDSKGQIKESNIGKSIYPLEIQSNRESNITITNSFGMPSKSIKIWQTDIELANNKIDKNQIMIVSCVGTQLNNRTLVEDFVLCAQKAVEAGAKIIELNYSCPNVKCKTNSVYENPQLSSTISKKVKQAIKHIPIIIKIGYIDNYQLIKEVIKSNAPFINGIAAINSIPMQIRNKKNNNQFLLGKDRMISGVCGYSIKNLALKMIKKIAEIIKKENNDIVIFGTGGIQSTQDIQECLEAGANIVMSATCIMWDPWLARKWQIKCKNEY